VECSRRSRVLQQCLATWAGSRAPLTACASWYARTASWPICSSRCAAVVQAVRRQFNSQRLPRETFSNLFKLATHAMKATVKVCFQSSNKAWRFFSSSTTCHSWDTLLTAPLNWKTNMSSLGTTPWKTLSNELDPPLRRQTPTVRALKAAKSDNLSNLEEDHNQQQLETTWKALFEMI